MSFGLVLENDNMLSFKDYIALSESVSPKETEFGSDFKNKAWRLTPSKSHLYTFFSHTPEHHVCVNINRENGVMGFGIHHGEPSTNTVKYNTNRTGAGDALHVFNKVAHVAIQGAKHHDIKHIKFDGADKQLDKTYHMIANNKFFQKHMKNHGFTYTGQDENGHHVFSKE